ncbi:hypothetical protein TNCV_3022641 [Trichonephila clavipes]|nr:hypothetical protein TNCV_3022641 [Trichonephila clavipes]
MNVRSVEKNKSLQELKGTVDGYEWRCRSQLKDNPNYVVRSPEKDARATRSVLIASSVSILLGMVIPLLFPFTEQETLTLTYISYAIALVLHLTQVVCVCVCSLIDDALSLYAQVCRFDPGPSLDFLAAKSQQPCRMIMRRVQDHLMPAWLRYSQQNSILVQFRIVRARLLPSRE